MLSNGDVKNIVDTRLQGDFDVNSVSKAIELALACVSPEFAARPAMNYLVKELRKCLAIEIAGTKRRHETE